MVSGAGRSALGGGDGLPTPPLPLQQHDCQATTAFPLPPPHSTARHLTTHVGPTLRGTCVCRSEVRATSGKGFVRLMAEHEWLHLFYNYQVGWLLH